MMSKRSGSLPVLRLGVEVRQAVYHVHRCTCHADPEHHRQVAHHEEVVHQVVLLPDRTLDRVQGLGVRDRVLEHRGLGRAGRVFR